MLESHTIPPRNPYLSANGVKPGHDQCRGQHATSAALPRLDRAALDAEHARQEIGDVHLV
jgi:hypothetical protein